MNRVRGGGVIVRAKHPIALSPPDPRPWPLTGAGPRACGPRRRIIGRGCRGVQGYRPTEDEQRPPCAPSSVRPSLGRSGCGGAGVAASSTSGAQKQGPGSDPPVSLDPGRRSGGQIRSCSRWMTMTRRSARRRDAVPRGGRQRREGQHDDQRSCCGGG
jgi:hypothetical protein